MFRRFSTNFALFSMGFDLVLVILVLAVATHIRPSLSALPYTASIEQPLQIPALLYALFSITWVTILALFSVYDGRRNLHIADELSSLTLGSILAGIALAGLLYLSYREISRALFMAFVILAFLSLVFWRLCARLIFRLTSNFPESQRRILIVGSGLAGRQMEQQILKNPYLSLYVVGFLDDDHEKWITHPDILGRVGDAHQIVQQKRVDDVVIALPQTAHEEATRLIADLHTLPVKIWVIPDYFHLALHKAAVEEFAGMPMLDLSAAALDDYQRMMKRTFDLFITLIFLPFSLVLMGMIALAIRLEGPGPVIFRQKRAGENGRLFEMLKFRTMVENAESLRHLVEHIDENGKLIHKTAGDPRVTRVGRFLRRTSLDELPQVFNILKGEMSLVGPRPELPYLVALYEPWQRKRFAVPQGITGWWQVNGRSDKPMHLHIDADLFYIQNYSLLFDMYILIKTVWVVLRGSGAY